MFPLRHKTQKKFLLNYPVASTKVLFTKNSGTLKDIHAYS